MAKKQILKKTIPLTPKKKPATRKVLPKKIALPLSSKQQQLLSNLSQTLLQCLGGRRYIPLTQKELFTRLHIPSQLIDTCAHVISDLISEGKIEIHNDTLSIKTEKPDVVSGVLRMHPKGFGFVIPDHPLENPQDIFIPKHLTDTAVDGDVVEVVLHTGVVSEKGPEGKIIAVTKRARKHAAGIINHVSADKSILAYVPLLGATRPVRVLPSKESRLKIGDRVILDIKDWGSKQEMPVGEFSHLLGSIDNAATDTLAAVEEFDLRNTFPKAAIDEAKKYGKKVAAKELKNRRDFSQEECFTIDPDTAKDFDDALTLTKDRKGHYHLGVHIADVAHYVVPGNALDKEAFLRGNSTYLPGTCIPMLPEELSNELCSLQPDKERLTVSVLMQFDKQGTLVKHEVVRGFINSKKRFTYYEAKDVLDGKTKSPHAKTLKLMVELCGLLKQKRYERGSIDFSLAELSLVINEKGEPTGFKKIEYDITHQLVEEFMLKANETVALELHKRGKELIYRVHEEPQEENFEEFLKMARLFGFKVPLKATSQDLQSLFEEAKKTPFAQQLSIAFIRSMRLAQYSQENVGHFEIGRAHV